MINKQYGNRQTKEEPRKEELGHKHKTAIKSI
jgi:hypothetical protein